MIWTVLLAASALAWAVLLLARGGFWRADRRLPAVPAPGDWPAVTTVIPARNEAATIAEVVAAHRASGYPGAFQVVVVDDSSGDGTGALARAAGAEVVTAPPLPAGWSGKLWALETGLRGVATDWVLLTDADIRHAPGTLARLVAFAEAEGLAMVSLMARLDARGVWGRLLIPAFVFFFQKLYPFGWVNDPRRATAGAAGGCVLIRAEALAAIGGIAAMRGALIDDCTLAARVKATGRAIWLGLAQDEIVSLRDNRRLGSVWTMVARTAFTQLGHSGWRLAGAVAGMALVYLVPVAAVLTGRPEGLAVWAAMGLAYAPTVRLYGLSWGWALTLPAAALLYTAMTVDSARAHWSGRGGAWKGRTYPAP